MTESARDPRPPLLKDGEARQGRRNIVKIFVAVPLLSPAATAGKPVRRQRAGLGVSSSPAVQELGARYFLKAEASQQAQFPLISWCSVSQASYFWASFRCQLLAARFSAVPGV